MKWSVFKDGHLAAYVTTEVEPDRAGIVRSGQNEPISPLDGGRVELFLKEYESLIVELAAKGVDGVIFGLKIEGFEVFEGTLAPTNVHRRF